jgi:branched-chain amino acid transport system permease protein
MGALALSLALIALAVLAEVAFSAADQRATVNFFITAIAVIALGTFAGNSGILSFGHVSFMAIGAYAAGILTLSPALKAVELPKLPTFLAESELGLIPAVLIAAALVGGIALCVGVPISRLNETAAVIASMALLMITFYVLSGTPSFTRGSQTFYGLSAEITLPLVAAWAVVVVFVARLFRDSFFGLRLRASREDELAAQSCGVNIARHRLVAWVLSAALTAMAGALLGHFIGAFSPKLFYWQLTFSIIAMLVVGGRNTVSGAVAGALLLTMLTEVLRRLETGPTVLAIDLPEVLGLTTIGMGLAILAVLYFRREGLLGLHELDEVVRARRRRRTDAPAEPRTGNGRARTPQSEVAVGREDAESLLARSVSKDFSGLQALQDVELSLRRGEIVGIIGPNGSGKSTLLNVISGVTPPTRGEVWIGERDITGWGADRVARAGVARTFQNIRLFKELTVRENVEVALSASSRRGRAASVESSACELLAALRIDAFEDAFAGTLPYGLQRRLEIARAIATGPAFLLLDEPAAGMNEVETDDLLEALRALHAWSGVGIVMVDHVLRLVMTLCERVVVMDAGRVIAADSPSKIQSDPVVIEAYLGIPQTTQGGTS